jgi:hypothetical protein
VLLLVGVVPLVLLSVEVVPDEVAGDWIKAGFSITPSPVIGACAAAASDVSA